VYVIGAMVAGIQSGKVFIENGRFHGQQAIEAIARGSGVVGATRSREKG
jgi:hypothetical protein